MIRTILLFAFTLYIATSMFAAEPINVRDYGAVGDNLTDDTAAFQKALDACWDSLGGVVSVPTGNYLIRGLYGQPLGTGIFVDQCFDVGRIEDVHFWSFSSEALIPFTQKVAVAFRFARTDWEMLSGCFCLGYKIGFHFTAIRHDAGNALIVNSGPDVCAVGVQVDYSQVHAGILFQNCQINAGVQVDEGSLGPVKFMNCGLFGTGVAPLPYLEQGGNKATQAVLRGQGRATFIGCHFYQPEGPFVPK
ncbi:MAG: glycosyl hydrolase family 28-related protein, partial [Aureliella sp.]